MHKSKTAKRSDLSRKKKVVNECCSKYGQGVFQTKIASSRITQIPAGKSLSWALLDLLPLCDFPIDILLGLRKQLVGLLATAC